MNIKIKINWKIIKDFAIFGAVIGTIWGVILFILLSLIGGAMVALGGSLLPSLGGLFSMVGLGAIVFSIIAGALHWGLAGLVFQKVRERVKEFKGFWSFVLSAFVVSFVLTVIEALVGLPLLNAGVLSAIGLGFMFIMIAAQAWIGLWVYRRIGWKAPYGG